MHNTALTKLFFCLIVLPNLLLVTSCSQPEHLKDKSKLAQWMHQRVSRDICFDESIKECALGLANVQKTKYKDTCISELINYQPPCQVQSFPSLQGKVSDKDLNQYPVYQACIAAAYLNAHNIEQSTNNSCQKIYDNALTAAGNRP